MIVSKVKVGDKHTIVNYKNGGTCSLTNNHPVSVIQAGVSSIIVAKNIEVGFDIVNFFPKVENA